MRLKVSNVCQLLDKSKYPATQTKQGVTYTNDGNGIITINGTNTASYLCVFLLNVLDGKPGHKYMQLGATDDGFWNRYGLELKWVDGDGVEHGFIMTNGIMSIPSDAIVRNIYVSVLVYQGYTVSNKTFKPQLFDLTEMYGAGNEPTTVAQFRQDFPNEMYEYSPVCWKKFRRLKYVTETKNLFNKNNATIINGYIYSGQLIIAESPHDRTIVFPCKPNTTYTFSKMYTNRLFMAETSEETPAVGTTCTNPIESLGEPPSQNYCTLTTTATAKNLIITVCTLYNTETYTLQEILDSVQIEEGSTASTYQPYGYLPLNRGKYIANKEPVQLLDKNETVKPQLFDLTTMYGAGNEPTTVAQFRADYPNELYDYNPYNAITFR